MWRGVLAWDNTTCGKELSWESIGQFSPSGKTLCWVLLLILNACSNKQPLILIVQLGQGHMTTTCTFMTTMYDHHVQAHSIHLVPRGLHSSVQVHQSQSKVRQTRKDNKDMKSLSFPTCSYSSQQVVRRILGCGYARNEYVTDSLCSWASPTSQQFLLDIVYGSYTQTTKLGCESGGLASAFGSWLVSHWLCFILPHLEIDLFNKLKFYEDKKNRMQKRMPE